MIDKIRSPERGSERIPTEEEVRTQIEKILDGRDYEVMNRVVDADGLQILDIVTTDEDGDRLELLYKRAGPSGRGVTPRSVIEEVLYFQGEPCGVGSYVYSKITLGETPNNPIIAYSF